MLQKLEGGVGDKAKGLLEKGATGLKGVLKR